MVRIYDEPLVLVFLGIKKPKKKKNTNDFYYFKTSKNYGFHERSGKDQVVL
jgi:hypothetical protein